jgi:hypothetical protein
MTEGRHQPLKYMLASGGSEEAAAADAWRHYQL